MKAVISETKLKWENANGLAAPGTISFLNVLGCAWPALVLATLCLLPFLNKAFLVDDSWFLMMSQQIIKHPMHPMGFDVCWDTIDSCTKAYVLTPGNSLMGYVLVPTILTGGHEWTAHMTQLVLAWIAIAAMTSLILRFGWDRWHATVGALLLVAIPPFLPMASTAMPDLLATAVALVAMERIAAWKTEQNWDQGVEAAIALGLAGFARSHLALLLPLAAFFLLVSLDPKEILRQSRRQLWLWSPVFAGFILLWACIFAVREHNLALGAPPVVVGLGYIPLNLPTYLAFFAFPLPLAACRLANRWKYVGVGFVLILATLAVAGILTHWRIFAVLCLALLGLRVLAELFLQAFERRDHIDLSLVLWVLIPLPIVYYTHLPIKYLLPCTPAVILLCFRLLDGVPLKLARVVALALIVASTSYSLLILHADAEFADFGRDALYRLITPHVAAGETVWYPGQYWSFWYAPLDGAHLTFPGGPQPKPGDLVVVDLHGAGMYSPLARFPHRTLVDELSLKYSFGRTMEGGMGLYDNRSGFWLWGFGKSDRDRFKLWRID
jgi:hypothetical protein